MIARQDKILSMVDRNGRGLEIGASYNPILPKKGGHDIKTVDHASAHFLRAKYANDPNVIDKLDNIEEVDFVWTGEPLDKLVGGIGSYDYIIASHVIEHMPDLLGFLKGCEALLTENGVLSLAVPDKRYCFDYFRPHSTPGAVLDAHFSNRNRHAPGILFDATLLGCAKHGNSVWLEGAQGPLSLLQGADAAWRRYNQARATTEYLDAHAWQFTPSSFRLILQTLYDLRLINLRETKFFETCGCEFMIGLSKRAPAPAHDYLNLCLGIETELAAGSGYAPKNVPSGLADKDSASAVPVASRHVKLGKWRHKLLRSIRKTCSLNGLRRIVTIRAN